jgi:hypothetical protein
MRHQPSELAGGGLAGLVGGGLVSWQVATWQDWGGLKGWQASGGLPVLSVYCDVEKPSTNWGFRVPKFELSLVLYFSQACLQCLSKVPDSRSSCSLCLCPSHHFGSSPKSTFCQHFKVGESFTLRKNGLYFMSSFLCMLVSTNDSCSHSKSQSVDITPLVFSSMEVMTKHHHFIFEIHHRYFSPFRHKIVIFLTGSWAPGIRAVCHHAWVKHSILISLYGPVMCMPLVTGFLRALLSHLPHVRGGIVMIRQPPKAPVTQ